MHTFNGPIVVPGAKVKDLPTAEDRAREKRRAFNEAEAPHMEVSLHLFADTFVRSDGVGDTGPTEWVQVGNDRVHFTIYGHDPEAVDNLIEALVRLRDRRLRY